MTHPINPPAPPVWRMFGRVDSHHRFFISLGVAAVCFVVMPHYLTWAARILGTWNAFVYTTLGLVWTMILSAEPEEVVSKAKLEDSSRTAIFTIVLLGACASLFAVAFELATAKALDHRHAGMHVFFSIATIAASWVLVHTTFTLRYAHYYYATDETNEKAGGLNFPDEPEPDYLDFAYFSFVLGMCSQVSDVSISSSRLRRLALVHGLISFAFNVAIIGFSINTVSSLLS